ncbi:MAG: enoyl-CoA hydratase/isomerase family protein [Rhodospirillaceae bacterium]|nr:enoyl-CoA hydratase/isomerase family protein [Rhodospirillaceae bacterium]
MAIDFSVRDRVATVMLNRPEAMNAIDPETEAELKRCLAEISADDAIRVAIVTGAGERAFCSGADLKKTMPPKESFASLAFSAARADPFTAAMAIDKPLVAAINGYAIGGGLELALACDIRIAADTARFGLAEVRIGTIPGAGGTQYLPRIIGATNAMMLLVTGDQIDAPEALRIGLVSRVVSLKDLKSEAEAIAARIAANGPLAVKAVKRLVRLGAGLPLDRAAEMERFVWGLLRDTEDRIEGRLAFQEKRKPVFRGR